MKNEYIIINKTAIQKRIEVLKRTGLARECHITEYETWTQILEESTPLIPEIEKAFDTGKWGAYSTGEEVQSAEHYISNLKLDI